MGHSKTSWQASKSPAQTGFSESTSMYWLTKQKIQETSVSKDYGCSSKDIRTPSRSWPCPSLSASHSDGFSSCGGSRSLATPAETEHPRPELEQMYQNPLWLIWIGSRDHPRTHNSDWPGACHVPIPDARQGHSALGDEGPSIRRCVLQLSLFIKMTRVISLVKILLPQFFILLIMECLCILGLICIVNINCITF